MAGPLAGYLRQGEEVRVRPIATFMHANSGQEYRAGAYLTNLALYVVNESTDQPVATMPIVQLLEVQRRGDWLRLTFEPPDDGPPIVSILKVTPSTTADIFLNYMLKDYETLTGKPFTNPRS